MRKIIVCAILLLGVSGTQAQTALTVDAPRVVQLGTPFRLVFSVNAAATNFTPPPLDAFSVLAGPTSSTSQGQSNVNGQRTSWFSTGYTYVVEAMQEGKITIGSGSVVVEGKTIQSDPVTIEVIKGEAAPQERDPGIPSGATGEISAQDLYLRLELNKIDVVKGEPITATLRLYARVPVEGFSDVRFPTFTGFWSQETETPSTVNFTEENIGGKIYRVALLRRYVLLPQQTGAIKIDPSELVCMVQVRRSNQNRSMFDMFFDDYQTVRKRVATPVQTVNVQPLPAGAPASFTGAVGSYSLSVSADKDTLNAHDAVSIAVRISGEGNVNLIEAPKVAFPVDFEVYDTRTTDNSKSRGNTISGTKQFEYPVIPRSAGTFILDPVEFSYWDVAKKSYVTLKSNPLTLRVGKGSGNSSIVGYDPGVGQVAVRTLGQDIRYIRTALPALVPLGRLFMGSPLFWALAAIVVAGFFAAYQWLLRQRARNRDLVSVKSRKANKQAKIRLKRGGELLKSGDHIRFYEEVHRALWGYVGDKLGLPPADHAKEPVCILLRERKASEESVSAFLDLIESCEYARYAPAPEAGAMDKIYDRALTLISNLEQTIK
ncbi:MAG: BatD family protein [Bacteroidetes bacterium]|nr:BatD family protein [Bacteroidota bacterium]